MTLFGRIARHGTSLVNPREDRLTEICAALFDSDECHGLARHVSCGWLEAASVDTESSAAARFRNIREALAHDPAWNVRITTQPRIRTTEGWRRPDLELSYELDGGVDLPPRRVLLWVEVKHGTAPHDDQLHWYIQAQRERGVELAAVLLLAPRADYAWFDPGQIPPDVPGLTWEDTARIIDDFHTTDPVGMFLVGELKKYLEEEGLVDPPDLTRAYIDALVNHKISLKALTRTCDQAVERTKATWGNAEAGIWPKQGEPRSFWWSYPGRAHFGSSVIVPDEWDLNWQLLLDGTDEIVDGRPGAPVFIAGLSAEPGTLTSVDPSVLQRLSNDGIEPMAPPLRSRRWEYLARIVYLDDLLDGGDVRDQARKLADWVDRTFTKLAAVLKTER